MKRRLITLITLAALPLTAVAIASTPPASTTSDRTGTPDSATTRASQLTNTCSSCHGKTGNSTNPEFPNLAGQNANYIVKQLEDFRGGSRKASPMSAMAATIPGNNEKNLKTIASYFSGQKLNQKATGTKGDKKSLLAQGLKIYSQGIPANQVPACSACHGVSGKGNNPMAIPSLAGQHASYLEKQLRRFASGKRHNSRGHVMQTIASNLTNAQIHALSSYLQAMQPSAITSLITGGYSAWAKLEQNQGIAGIGQDSPPDTNRQQHNGGDQ